MQGAEHPDDRENGQAQCELDSSVTRKPAKGPFAGKTQTRGEPQPVGCSERQHYSKDAKLEQQQLPVPGSYKLC